MKTLFAVPLIAAALGALGCNDQNKERVIDRPDNRATLEHDQKATPKSLPASIESDPNNTVVNSRDRDGTSVTPMDQAENPTDRTITQNVRQAVMKDDGLSTTAKNVKIITSAQSVTLRGTVKTAEEKAEIEALARRTNDVKSVDDQIDVETHD